MFFALCFVLTLSFAAAVPMHRQQDEYEGTNRRISLDKLLDTKTSFTRAALDYYISILDDYKDYVPKEVQAVFDGLSDRAKNEIVAGANDIEAGRIKIPNNPQKIIDYVAKRSPELGDNIDKAMDMLMTNLNKVRPETKAGFNVWWKKIFEAISVPRDQLANCIARLIADFKAAYDKGPAFMKNDVAKAWPEAYNLLESDFASKFAAAAKKFADGGLTMDIHMLGADADYPPKAPKIKINDRQPYDAIPLNFD
ncbi:hypothetical protein OESDEN_17385 [Oesophagostomum dentatum]|uniref:Nematode fatty acid retinoid binding protein n=1 Tax=Oesophagostomum dentatum TaxID=61180 RepID=A0A0B1SI73_OESDE|nr:hypothetical protein OESDEN_17385 [Oesophagostomum dentatum]